MSGETVVGTAVLGPYTFEEVAGHRLASAEGKTMWRFRIEGTRDNHTMFHTLDHALASAIAERWTGPRGAGGSGVGTAADWFMAMIGAYRLAPAGAEGTAALRDNLSAMEISQPNGVARRLEEALERQGLTIARYPEGPGEKEV